MPLFHDTLWRVTAIDIEYTLAKVMQRVWCLKCVVLQIAGS